MLRPVTVNLTANQESFAYTYPFSRAFGSDQSAIYKLPRYQMFLENNDGERVKFLVMRFGMQKKADGSHSITGLRSTQTHTLRWINSDIGWVWLITGNHLIHTGTMYPTKPHSLGAVTGCVAITGFKEGSHEKEAWPYFNEKIVELTGAKNEQEASDNDLVTMNIEAAFWPKATRVKSKKGK